MQERHKTSVTIFDHDNDTHDDIKMPPMTAREQLKLAEKVEAFGVTCLTRREKEAKRRLDKAAKLESEAAALRGESA